MAHAQKPDFVFRRNGRVHLNRRGRQFSRLMAAEVCASAVVMLDTPCSEVMWRVLATHSIRQFPLHFPSRASPCAITFQLDSNSRTSNCQCNLFSDKNTTVRNFCISGWLAVPINPDKWRSTVLTDPPITVRVMWIRKLEICGSVPIRTKPWTKVLESLKHNCQSSTPANYCRNTVLLLFLSLLSCLNKLNN